jgi:Skp family chaperone for outer membrane proteins
LNQGQEASTDSNQEMVMEDVTRAVSENRGGSEASLSGDGSVETPQTPQPKRRDMTNECSTVSGCVSVAVLDADEPKTTPSKRVFQEVDKSIDLRVELRALHADVREYHERESDLRRENRKLKAKAEQEKLASERQRQQQTQELTKFKESITTEFTRKLEEYRAQVERESKEMAEGFARELAKARESRHWMLSASPS